MTTTDAGGRTVVATYHPPGADISEVVYKTTQLPNGQQSTITSLTRVGQPTIVPDSGNGASTSKPPPGLQSGAESIAGRYIAEMAVLLAGAIGIAALL